MCQGSAVEVSRGEKCGLSLDVGREEERCSQATMEEPLGPRCPHIPQKVRPWGPAAWQVGNGPPGASAMSSTLRSLGGHTEACSRVRSQPR